MKNFIMAGQAVKVGEKVSLENNGTLLNVTIEFKSSIYAGIIEIFEKRIVLFDKLAKKAHIEVSEGDFVLFSECRRNPRRFITNKGTECETCDIIANRFTVIDQDVYEQNSLVFIEDMPSMSELIYTKKDREASNNKSLNIIEGDII